MSVYTSNQTGVFSNSAIWSLIDATSYNNSETTTTALTTSYQGSSAFTPGAITVDGVFVKLSVCTGTTGTISVHLAQGGVEVSGTLVTINTADLPVAATADLNGGWIFFKFASPVLLLAATAYTVEAKTSSSSQVSLFSTATTNWARALRTTTTAGPTTGDDLIVAGEYTGAGTSNSFTVTMDNTAATDFGSNTTSLVTPSLAICSKGTLTFDTTVNSLLRQSGHVIVYSGGTLNIGTVATPVPRNKTAILEFDCAADGDFGLVVRNLGMFVAQGLSRTSGKNIYYCLLNGNAAANATSLSVDTDTGWLSGDSIAVASTTRTASQCEKGTLNGGAGASSLTVNGFAGTGGGVLNAHLGTSPTQAEVILLTRNVVIRAVTANTVTFLNFKATATVDCDWVEFYYLGTNTAGKRGIEAETSTGSCSIQYCSIHDTENAGAFTMPGGVIDNITFQYNVCWNINTGGNGNAGVFLTTSNAGSSGAGILIDNNVMVLGGSGNQAITMNSVGATITNNRIAGFVVGIGYGNAATTAVIGTVSGNQIHSCSGAGMSVANSHRGTISNTTVWRCGGVGISLSNTPNGLTIDTATLFGNTTSNINFDGSIGNIILNSITSNGDSTFATASGVSGANAQANADVIFNNCNFGTASGILTAHTQDINVSGPTMFWQLRFRNSLFASSTLILNQTSLPDGAFIASQKHNQTAGDHRRYYRYGTIQTDTVTYKTASPAMKMTPNNATFKFASPTSDPIPVANGAALTVTVYVNKSASYNGNQPRLIVKANAALGINSDTVLATASGGTGSWLTLSGMTATVTNDGSLQFVVDCDGTAGTVSVDDWSWSGGPVSGSCENKYWHDGRPVLANDAAASGVPVFARGMNKGAIV